MARIYDPQSMVELPSLDAMSGSTVVTAMLHASSTLGKKLSAAVLEAKEPLAKAEANLVAALRKSVASPEAGGEVARPERAEAAIWVSTEKWAAGLMSIPMASAKTAMAGRIHQKLFGEGIGFVRGASHKRWAAAQARLDIVHEEKLAADFKALGGEDLLAAIEAAHRATGQALGFNSVLPAAEPPQVRSTFDEVKAALREYVIQVVAFGRTGGGANQELANQLLAPLTSYEAPARKVVKPAGDGSAADGKTETAATDAGKEQAEGKAPASDATTK